MKKILSLIFLSLIFFSSALTKNCFSLTKEEFEQLRRAFRKGFLSQKVKGIEIYSMMKEKYQEKPLLYVEFLRELKKNHTMFEPLIYFVYDLEKDDLGRLVIVRKIKISALDESDFSSAFYLLSLLGYRKDFQNLRELENLIDQKYEKELSIDQINESLDEENHAALKTESNLDELELEKVDPQK